MPKITTLGDLRPDYGQGLPTDWASAWIRTSPLLIAVLVLALACLGVFL